MPRVNSIRANKKKKRGGGGIARSVYGVVSNVSPFFPPLCFYSREGVYSFFFFFLFLAMPGRLKFRFEAEELWILIKINHNCKGLIENYFALRYIVWDVISK